MLKVGDRVRKKIESTSRFGFITRINVFSNANVGCAIVSWSDPLDTHSVEHLDSLELVNDQSIQIHTQHMQSYTIKPPVDHSKHEVVKSQAAGETFLYCRQCKVEVQPPENITYRREANLEHYHAKDSKGNAGLAYYPLNTDAEQSDDLLNMDLDAFLKKHGD
jgi:hypothetical protein